MKTYKRKFETQINLELHTRYAYEVISLIENDTINVFRSDDELAVSEVHGKRGEILLDDRATVPVSIREWLPVVCQFIRWESSFDFETHGGGEHDSAVACYRSNACEVLWPVEGFEAAGPGALIAGIVLRERTLLDNAGSFDIADCNRFRFVLAHELAHAFHAMRFVVPAFMDWPTFWEKVLHEGTTCDLLCSNHGFRTGSLDRYGSELELAEVMQFWPSYGKR
ncbi:MAG: hypothetical protein KAV87_62255, partial [Desulfobacteraceae bacterium]|nr:hypothetical protein [Desulfobacteraceae bacterium]